MKQESEVKSHEIEKHKFAIAQRDVEIQQLLRELQEQQTLQHQLSSQLQEEKEREVAAVIMELQSRLSQAEQAKNWADGELVAAQLQIDRLREREDELKRTLQVTVEKKVHLV